MRTPLRYWCLGLLFLSAVAASPFRVVRVDGHSMEPTIHHGQAYLLDRQYFRVFDLRRDDVVVIRFDDQQLVKRLVGMPGDVLQLRRAADGWITEVHNLTVRPERGAGAAESDDLFTVPAGRIFLLGDNMNGSEDSRGFGCVRLEDVQGVVRTFTLKRHFPWPHGEPGATVAASGTARAAGPPR